MINNINHPSLDKYVMIAPIRDILMDRMCLSLDQATRFFPLTL